jgi:hypothetical protein
MPTNLVDNIEWYYTNFSVYRSLVICCTDEDVILTANTLRELNHSICTITTDDLDDERQSYISRLEDFKNQSCYRMMMISYQAFISIRPLIEQHILPEQNLVVFDKISDDNIKYVSRWLLDAKCRGFITRTDCAFMANVDDEPMSLVI